MLRANSTTSTAATPKALLVGLGLALGLLMGCGSVPPPGAPGGPLRAEDAWPVVLIRVSGPGFVWERPGLVIAAGEKRAAVVFDLLEGGRELHGIREPITAQLAIESSAGRKVIPGQMMVLRFQEGNGPEPRGWVRALITAPATDLPAPVSAGLPGRPTPLQKVTLFGYDVREPAFGDSVDRPTFARFHTVTTTAGFAPRSGQGFLVASADFHKMPNGVVANEAHVPFARLTGELVRGPDDQIYAAAIHFDDEPLSLASQCHGAAAAPIAVSDGEIEWELAVYMVDPLEELASLTITVAGGGIAPPQQLSLQPGQLHKNFADMLPYFHPPLPGTTCYLARTRCKKTPNIRDFVFQITPQGHRADGSTIDFPATRTQQVSEDGLPRLPPIRE